MSNPNQKNILLGILLALIIFFLGWSGYNPKDRVTWLLEVAPVMIGLVVMFWTRQSFPLTNLLYILITIHCVILCVGGRYTYAEVPVGFWVSDLFGWTRNHYDRLGHLAQGFVPAILAREILIRHQVVKNSKWLILFTTCICLSFSAFYEFIEWWTALISGEGATAFLGTQGDIWDTQWDMFLALVGAISAQIILSRAHDKQLSSQP